MTSAKLTLTNVKAHFIVSREINLKEKLAARDDVKLFHNFIVLKNKFTYIVFFNVNYVNVTSIKETENCISSSLHFCNLLSFEEKHISPVEIDNLTLTINLQRKINVQKSVFYLRKNGFIVKFNNQVFPAAFARREKITGSLSIFRTGKLVIVGCKTIEEGEKLFSQAKKWLLPVKLSKSVE